MQGFLALRMQRLELSTILLYIQEEHIKYQIQIKEEDKHEKDTCIDFDPGLEPGGPHRLRLQDGNARRYQH